QEDYDLVWGDDLTASRQKAAASYEGLVKAGQENDQRRKRMDNVDAALDENNRRAFIGATADQLMASDEQAEKLYAMNNLEFYLRDIARSLNLSYDEYLDSLASDNGSKAGAVKAEIITANRRATGSLFGVGTEQAQRELLESITGEGGAIDTLTDIIENPGSVSAFDGLVLGGTENNEGERPLTLQEAVAAQMALISTYDERLDEVERMRTERDYENMLDLAREDETEERAAVRSAQTYAIENNADARANVEFWTGQVAAAEQAGEQFSGYLTFAEEGLRLAEDRLELAQEEGTYIGHQVAPVLQHIRYGTYGIFQAVDGSFAGGDGILVEREKLLNHQRDSAVQTIEFLGTATGFDIALPATPEGEVVFTKISEGVTFPDYSKMPLNPVELTPKQAAERQQLIDSGREDEIKVWTIDEAVANADRELTNGEQGVAYLDKVVDYQTNGEKIILSGEAVALYDQYSGVLETAHVDYYNAVKENAELDRLFQTGVSDETVAEVAERHKALAQQQAAFVNQKINILSQINALISNNTYFTPEAGRIIKAAIDKETKDAMTSLETVNDRRGIDKNPQGAVLRAQDRALTEGRRRIEQYNDEYVVARDEANTARTEYEKQLRVTIDDAVAHNRVLFTRAEEAKAEIKARSLSAERERELLMDVMEYVYKNQVAVPYYAESAGVYYVNGESTGDRQPHGRQPFEDSTNDYTKVGDEWSSDQIFAKEWKWNDDATYFGMNTRNKAEGGAYNMRRGLLFDSSEGNEINQWGFFGNRSSRFIQDDPMDEESGYTEDEYSGGFTHNFFRDNGTLFYGGSSMAQVDRNGDL
ncbi:MAG: hypothetical protein KAR32_08730, partial [Candidatus Omnitrophica bacterium]|nr:hypothetical protein [Candidatus Omnitrophota bacterium]